MFSPMLSAFGHLMVGGRRVTIFHKFGGPFFLIIGKLFKFWANTKVITWLSKFGQYKSHIKVVQNRGGRGSQLHCTMSKRKTLSLDVQG